MPVGDVIIVRHGTSDEWIAANPVLAEGEIGYSTDEYILKFGDGIHQWTDLIESGLNLGDRAFLSALAVAFPELNQGPTPRLQVFHVLGVIPSVDTIDQLKPAVSGVLHETLDFGSAVIASVSGTSPSLYIYDEGVPTQWHKTVMSDELEDLADDVEDISNYSFYEKVYFFDAESVVIDYSDPLYSHPPLIETWLVSQDNPEKLDRGWPSIEYDFENKTVTVSFDGLEETGFFVLT